MLLVNSISKINREGSLETAELEQIPLLYYTMSQVCNNPIITFMSIVIISCDTTQVLYITRYHTILMVLCIYLQYYMTRHGATIRHKSEKKIIFARKGKSEF